MSLSLRFAILICGISFSFAIIKLLINRKFSEKISLIWLISAMAVFIISIFPKILDVFAKLLGVDYPPSILFLFAILILLFICFYHSIQISMLNNQVRELAQNMAIKEVEHVVDDENYKLKYKEKDNIKNDLSKEEHTINGYNK